MLPPSQEEEDDDDEGLDEIMKETAKEKEEKKSDYDVSRQDVVKVKQKWCWPFCFHLVIDVDWRRELEIVSVHSSILWADDLKNKWRTSFYFGVWLHLG